MSERDNNMNRNSLRDRGPGRGPHGISMPVEKAKNFKGTLKRLIKYLMPMRMRLIIVGGLAMFSTVFNILSPKVMGKATTKLFEGLMMKLQGIPDAAIDFDYIAGILMILTVLYIVSALFSYGTQYIMAGVAQKTVFDMRKDISEKLHRLPLKYFDSRTHGEILSRVTNDIDNISNTLQQSITQLITSIVTLSGIIIMMLTISPVMTLITLITLPLSIFITKGIAKKSQKYFKMQQKMIGELNGHVEEMYTGHKVVKAFGYEEKSLAAFQRLNDKLYNAGWKAQFVSGIIMPLMTFVSNIGYVFVSVVGGIFVTRRVIEIGDIQAFIQYSRQFSHPIVQTANIVNIIQSTVASAERVFEVLDEEEEEVKGNEIPVQLEKIRGEVHFKHVDFGYKKDVKLIEDMSFTAKSGQTVAIVGPTGAGKTTLVNLLLRFYEIDDGRITVDGIDIRDLTREGLRSLFGMVLQDAWLFKGSIWDNIAYGKTDATDKEILKAAEMAHVDHFVRMLPEGYQTELNEEANNISQGQKQLITIARAILADPFILILDEATSNVDTRTEIYIQKAMSELMKGRTNFVIAHRLSTIRKADIILVMNEGKIIEKGNHEVLMEKGGFYSDLYNSQFLGKPA